MRFLLLFLYSSGSFKGLKLNVQVLETLRFKV